MLPYAKICSTCQSVFWSGRSWVADAFGGIPYTHVGKPSMPIWTTEAVTAHLGPALPRIISVWPLVENEATVSQALREPEKDGDGRRSGQTTVRATKEEESTFCSNLF